METGAVTVSTITSQAQHFLCNPVKSEHSKKCWPELNRRQQEFGKDGQWGPVKGHTLRWGAGMHFRFRMGMGS